MKYLNFVDKLGKDNKKKNLVSVAPSRVWIHEAPTRY